jgi:threonine synthase
MQYYSTNNRNNRVPLKKAVLKGLADDKGLYMPINIPTVSRNFLQNISNYSFKEIGFEVAKAFFADDIPYRELENIIGEALNFGTPLVQLDDNTHILELWHGPTLAFKDVGARFMARLMAYFSKKDPKEANILVATSGDTGSAVANGFYKVQGIKVTILYPKNGVSKIQEQQLTTLGNNITALEIDGNFDDCQQMVKSAFSDDELNQKLFLTSANSINIARLIPQAFYYFNAYSQLKDKSRPLVFSVPSGNFGNLTAGLIAKKMGLPAEFFIAATNINDVVPEYLSNGIFRPRPSAATLSNAMDVGNPSNFSRMLDLYNNSVEEMRKDILGFSFTDDQTVQGMKEIYEHFKYIIDPHGAVAYLGIKEFLKNEMNNLKIKDKDKKKTPHANCILLETAHPAKFADTVLKALDIKVAVPERLADCLDKKKVSVPLSNKFDEFKSYLLKTSKGGS